MKRQSIVCIQNHEENDFTSTGFCLYNKVPLLLKLLLHWSKGINVIKLVKFLIIRWGIVKKIKIDVLLYIIKDFITGNGAK